MPRNTLSHTHRLWLDLSHHLSRKRTVALTSSGVRRDILKSRHSKPRSGMSLSSIGKKRWQHQEGWYRERWTVGSVGKYLYRLALCKTQKKSQRRVLDKTNK
jgi:hypothetical protein